MSDELTEDMIKVVKEFPEALSAIALILDVGARKHGEGSWKHKDNPSLAHRSNHASLSRHLADHYVGVPDPETGEDPLLFIMCRSMMKYTRKVRGIDETEKD